MIQFLRRDRIVRSLLRGGTWCVLGSSFATAFAAKKPVVKPQPDRAAMEAATRLQVFLDRAEFGPGKIDGHYGEFTLKALALYREAHGELAAPAPPAKAAPNAPPDVAGLELSSADPVFISYTVSANDLQSVGRVPAEVPAQAREKSLPYRDTAEAIAEKFHTDVDFLAQLNPGKTKAIKAGDQLSVPNVEPFELGAVKDLRPGSDVAPVAANDLDEEDDSKKRAPEKKEKPAQPTPITTAVRVDMKTSMLEVRDGEKLIAAFPVTIGSAQTESPVGDWKVRGVAKMPNFRYDKKMLNHGERSGDFHILPPGPNNPVGVVWIALNKKGIGLHGTSDPDAIGRSASHGCIRLANWDIVRLAAKVKTGVPVSIH